MYLLVPFICFKFNNIYYPGISSVDPSLQCILCVPGPVGDSRVRVRMQEMQCSGCWSAERPQMKSSGLSRIPGLEQQPQQNNRHTATQRHPPPQGPNEARPQVLPPQFFTFYYALLESMSHCLGRAARSLPSQELNFQCVQWPHSYILETISTRSLHVIL